MEKREGKGEAIGYLIGDVIGWIFCMIWLAGSYVIGVLAAHYLGAVEHQQSVGILSAMVTIWTYEHRLAKERWERLYNQGNRG